MNAQTPSEETPLDPDDELIVAYLDGELDRAAQSEFESRMVDDESLRHRLHALNVGWDLLADLSVVDSNPKLVETTLELAIAEAAAEKRSSGASIFRSVPLLSAIACFIGIGAVVAGAALVKNNRYRHQLQDLAIAENLDAYSWGKDLKLMRQLVADPEWNQMIEALREIGDLGDTSLPSDTTVAATPLDDREQMIANLPLEKRVELQSRWDRFSSRGEENKLELRRTADAVLSQADSEDLLETMRTYAVWREIIKPPELIDRIESDDPETRREAIKEAVKQTQQAVAERSSSNLDAEAIERIFFALRQVVRQRARQNDKQTLEALERWKKLDYIDPESYVVWEIVTPRSNRFRTRRYNREPHRPLSAGELDLIIVVLPDEVIEFLDVVTSGFPPWQTITLRLWAEEAARRKLTEQQSKISPRDRYRQLEPLEREEIELLPPGEILKRLSR